MRMTVEDRDDFESFALRFGEVIINIAFGVDYCGFAVAPEQVRGMGKSFDKKTF